MGELVGFEPWSEFKSGAARCFHRTPGRWRGVRGRLMNRKRRRHVRFGASLRDLGQNVPKPEASPLGYIGASFQDWGMRIRDQRARGGGSEGCGG